jgi:GntR family transcriptional repressor for pyruvate dehydrogenase complex
VRQVTKRNLPESVSLELTEMIRAGELKAGERLPSQGELAQLFGVGRSSIREATQALRVAGLIEVYPGRGTFVCDYPEAVLDSDQPAISRLKDLGAAQIYEARFILESALAALAAERASTEQIHAIVDAVENMRRTLSSPHEFDSHDLDFHLKLAEAAGNELLASFYRQSRNSLRGVLESIHALRGVAENALRLHEETARAVSARDSEAARASVDAWSDYTKQVLIEHGVLNRGTASPPNATVTDWGQHEG